MDCGKWGTCDVYYAFTSGDSLSYGYTSFTAQHGGSVVAATHYEEDGTYFNTQTLVWEPHVPSDDSLFNADKLAKELGITCSKD